MATDLERTPQSPTPLAVPMGASVPASVTKVPGPVELWEVNEQLVLTGLREHDLAEQLGHQLAFSRAITSSLGEGVYAVDLTGQITFVNPAAERMLGWQEGDLLGRDAYRAIPVQDDQSSSGPNAAAALRDVLRSGLPYRNDGGRFTRQDLTSFSASYSAAPIIADDRVVGAVVTFHDITEMQRLQRLQKEYLELISHDLRTPLTVILGHAQLLQRRNQSGRDASSVDAIIASSVHMSRTMQELLDRSRLVGSPPTLRMVQVDLVDLVRSSMSHNLTPGEQGRVEIDAVPQLVVVADAVQIERVIVNLLTNAFKYSSDTTPVVVRIFRAQWEAVIAVVDQGVGVDASDLVHLFEKHFRAQTAGAIAGTGLGLYGSRLIVEAHHGRIWAESEVGVGSTFCCSLPITDL